MNLGLHDGMPALSLTHLQVVKAALVSEIVTGVAHYTALSSESCNWYQHKWFTAVFANKSNSRRCSCRPNGYRTT